jgi:hypothetical protein
MAVTISLYNHTAKLFANGDVDIPNLKLMLLNNSASFTAANTTPNQVSNTGAYEVSGNGWAAGGVALAAEAVTTVTTNDAMLDANDVSVTASGGSIGPAYKALVLDATNSYALAFIDFGGSQEAGDGTDFKVVWAAGGLISWTYT